MQGPSARQTNQGPGPNVVGQCVCASSHIAPVSNHPCLSGFNYCLEFLMYFLLKKNLEKEMNGVLHNVFIKIKYQKIN